MNVTFAPDVLERLAEIENEDGTPPIDLVQQAVSVWCRLDAGERMQMIMLALQIVMNRRFK